jgi:4-hydroxy-tetrahydrodipicolinate reductase
MRIGLWGAQGRLGSLIVELLHKRSIEHTSFLRSDSLEDKAQKLSSLLKKPAVLIDVSTPQGTLEICRLLKETKEPLSHVKGLIIGSTGHEDKTMILNLAKLIPVSFIENFSLGLFLIEEILRSETRLGIPVKELIKVLGFDQGLIDIHHKHKKDAPSGTAKKLASLLDLETSQISSLRVGDVMGEHTLLFSRESEEVVLEHKAYNRTIFALGALTYAQGLFSKNLAPGLYEKIDLFN